MSHVSLLSAGGFWDASGHAKNRKHDRSRVKPESWTRQPGWPELVRRLAKHLDDRGRPVALAAVRIGI